jgi:hypothetical protein
VRPFSQRGARSFLLHCSNDGYSLASIPSINCAASRFSIIAAPQHAGICRQVHVPIRTTRQAAQFPRGRFFATHPLEEMQCR